MCNKAQSATLLFFTKFSCQPDSTTFHSSQITFHPLDNHQDQCWQGTGPCPCCTWSRLGWSGPSRPGQRFPHTSTRRPRSQICQALEMATIVGASHSKAPFCWSLKFIFLSFLENCFSSSQLHYLASLEKYDWVSGINIPGDVCYGYECLWVVSGVPLPRAPASWDDVLLPQSAPIRHHPSSARPRPGPGHPIYIRDE